MPRHSRLDGLFDAGMTRAERLQAALDGHRATSTRAGRAYGTAPEPKRRTTKTPEAGVLDAIRDALEAMGCDVMRNTRALVDHGRRRFSTGLAEGASDLVVVIPPPPGPYGIVGWVEVKAGRGTPSDKQEHFLSRMWKRRSPGCVVWSVEEAVAFVQQVQRGTFSGWAA